MLQKVLLLVSGLIQHITNFSNTSPLGECRDAELHLALEQSNLTGMEWRVAQVIFHSWKLANWFSKDLVVRSLLSSTLTLFDLSANCPFAVL